MIITKKRKIVPKSKGTPFDKLLLIKEWDGKMKKSRWNIVVMLLVCVLGLMLTTGCSSPCQSCAHCAGAACTKGCSVGCVAGCEACVKCVECIGCVDFCAGCAGKETPDLD